jgi:ribonuclease H2 subunit C
VKIPEGYKGVVLSCSTNSSEANDKCSGHRARKDEDDEDVIEESIMEEKADFADIMVWGHEASPDEATDPYLRGIQEWIAFAEVVSSLLPPCRPCSLPAMLTINRCILSRRMQRRNSNGH